MRLTRILATGCVALLIAVSPAWAAKKLALVVGINDYENVPKLVKAKGDARAISAKLKNLGFDVETVLDPDRRTFNLALSNLYQKVGAGDTVFIHYSGHGIQIAGQNHLLPSDIPSPSSSNAELLKSESITLSTVMDTLQETGAGTRIFIIDACRDNPYAQSGTRSIGGKRGLANIEVTKGSFVMYSAGAGQSALDRLSDSDPEETSVYMRVLLRTLDKPNVKLRDIAAEVRDEVEQMAKTVGHEQRPSYYDDLPASYMFVQDASLKPGGDDLKPVDPPVIDEDVKARAMWESSMNMDSPQVFDQIAMLYPDSPYAVLAKARAKELRDKEAARKKAEAERLKKEQAKKKDLEDEELLKQQANLGQPDDLSTQPQRPTRGVLQTDWAVVAGTYSLDRGEEADQRARELHANGFTSAIVIETNDYARLKPGLYAVVIPAKSDKSASNVVIGVKQLFKDAYTRKVR